MPREEAGASPSTICCRSPASFSACRPPGRSIWAGVAKRLRNPDLAVLSLEIAILAVLGCLPADTPNAWITSWVAFAASVQIGFFRQVEGHPYNSTFTTGNLRTLSDNVFVWLFQGRQPASKRMIRVFSTICAAFFSGAILGAFLTPLLRNKTLWPVCLLLGVLWLRLFASRTSPEA
ncbi:MAG: YoaK family protein [Ignavibacteriota bacterium]